MDLLRVRGDEALSLGEHVDLFGGGVVGGVFADDV